MNEFIIEEQTRSVGAKIKVIGVGGAGGNMINHMINEGGIPGIDFVLANTDEQALLSSPATTKIQIGEKRTKGLGAGMKPEVGKESALENYDEIKSAVHGADMVFIAAGLGGGTGTGAAPVVAQAAKEESALTVSIVTKPFRFEGKKREKLAVIGLEELKKESDSIVVIPNEKLLSVIDKNLGLKDSFKLVDEILARAVRGMSGVIISYGESDINLDFADVKTVMSHRGLALLGVGESTGEEAAAEAMQDAVNSPLLEDMNIDGAMGVLVHFYIHPSYPMLQISDAMNIVYESADEDADVIFGTTTDESIPLDTVKVTIVATGFERGELEQFDEKPAQKTANIDFQYPTLGLGKVSGSDFEETIENIAIPTYIRRQKD